jgi:hypothetical protein
MEARGRARDAGSRLMASAAPGSRLASWLRGHVPTRESIEANRWLRPIAHRLLVPSLWRLNRRSVPRGVALGLFCGIIFPFAHMLLAAVLALPLRANVPTAVGTTLVNNPVTFLPIMAAAYQIGHHALRFDRQITGQPIHEQTGWIHWLVAHGGPAIVGLIILAIGAAIVGYALAAFGWRLRTMRKWRRRASR